MTNDDPAVALLLKAGLLEETEGGYSLAGRSQLRGLEPFVLANIRSTLGQAYAIATGKSGWSRNDDEVLMSQGLTSSAGGRGLANMIEFIPELKKAFEKGGVLLDVGVGVAALACAFCEAVPSSKVIGLDVLPQALRLAHHLVSDKHLDDRVDLRHIGIENFDEEAVADLAHMSPVFISPALLPDGLNRIRRALKPCGWLALAGIVSDGPGGAAIRWMAHNAGGSALTDADATKLATDSGFAEPMVPPLPPASPRVLLFQSLQRP